MFSLGGRQRPASAQRTVGCEGGRAFQERRGRGNPSAGLGSTRGPHQLGRHILVHAGGSLGAMPGAAVCVENRIGGLSQGSMDELPVAFLCDGVGRRPNQRVGELDPRADVKKAGVHRRSRC